MLKSRSEREDDSQIEIRFYTTRTRTVKSSITFTGKKKKRQLKPLLQGQSCYKSELVYTINFPHGVPCFLLAKTVCFPLHRTRSVVIASSCNYTQLETDFIRTVLKQKFKALGHAALIPME